jgi:hypothetical protein
MMAYDFGSPSLNIGDSTLFSVKANSDEVQIEKLEEMGEEMGERSSSVHHFQP